MEELTKDEKVVFIGEGLINAGRIYGTLDGISKNKCNEMPIAVNLIAGVAIGLALQGFKPVVIFQRMDFMLIAADAIINHMVLIPKMSGGKINLPIIIRAIVGSQKESFCVGEQHNHDFTHIFSPYIPTTRLTLNMNASAYYDVNTKNPILVVEDRDRYEDILTYE